MKRFYVQLRFGTDDIDAQSWLDVEGELYSYANTGVLEVACEEWELVSTERRYWSSDWRGTKGPKGWVKKPVDKYPPLTHTSNPLGGEAPQHT